MEPNDINLNTVAPPPSPPLPPPPIPKVDTPINKILQFCLAIQHREGYYGPNQLAGYPHGTPAYINHNPGNLRCGADRSVWERRATGSSNGFCVFPDYDTGMEALQEVVAAVCKGLSPTYNAAAHKLGLLDGSMLSIAQYFVIRDPASDSNDPASFAAEVAGKLGLPASTHMKELLA